MHGAQADGGNLGSVIMRGKRDASNCGTLDNPCCIRAKGGRCKGRSLECAPVSGGNPRCRACGTSGLWACNGKRCAAGLMMVESPDGRICVPNPNPLPAGATTAVTGKNRKDRDRAKAKRDSDVGKKLLGGACKAASDCRASEACVGSTCQPCGGEGQPCCSGATPCQSFGEGSPPLVCEWRVALAANTCGVRNGDQTLV